MPDPNDAVRPDSAAAEAVTSEWDAFGLAREGLALWSAGCNAWSEYLTTLSQAMTPAAIFDAQARLFAEGLDLCAQATASRLKEAGVTAPLLNDA